MQSNFDQCLSFVLKYEGGYVDNPHDPGGATNMGVTQRTLSAWRRSAVSIDDVKALTREEVAQIYKAQYWDHVNGDNLPAGVDLAVFDYAVNSGSGRAARALQSVLGIAVDGSIGPETLANLALHPPHEVAASICSERLTFLQSLSTFRIFGRGWTNRVNACSAAAQCM